MFPTRFRSVSKVILYRDLLIRLERLVAFDKGRDMKGEVTLRGRLRLAKARRGARSLMLQELSMLISFLFVLVRLSCKAMT